MSAHRKAARVTDLVVCNQHGPSMISENGSGSVFVGGLPAARVSNGCLCQGAYNPILVGNPIVLVENLPIAREADSLEHAAFIYGGCHNVVVGSPATDADGNLLVLPDACAWLRQSIRDMFGGPAWAKHLPRRNYELSGARATTYADRDGHGQLPGFIQTVVIGGHEVIIITPLQDASPGHLPSAAEIAASLATLDDDALSTLTEVVLSPYPAPRPGVAANYLNGVVHVYPSERAFTQMWLDFLMLHEAGHGYDDRHTTPSPTQGARPVTATDLARRRP